jgi:hypothetical protein
MAESGTLRVVDDPNASIYQDPAALAAQIKELANEHFESPEIRYFFTTEFTPARARIYAVQMLHFVKNRRDCWALASSLAPLDVKRLIWAHEQDELIHDPRAGSDHFALMAQEAQLFGLSAEEVRATPPHPFTAAALDAWILLGHKSWLEAFAAVATVEIVNSDAIIRGGGFSTRIREKLVAELGHERCSLRNENVHIAADMEHVTILDEVLARHVTNACEARLVLEAAQHALVINGAYRGGSAFAMRQVD